MITQCSYCRMDTTGNHEYGCPCRQVNFPDDRTDFEKQINFQIHEATGDKPQPQVAPTIGDFSACLLNIEKSLSGLADIAESRSVTLGDEYGKLADGCIDAMEQVQVLRNQANGIELDEDDAV